jgi:hypothetical protein
MKILSEEEKTRLQQELTALMEAYGMPYSYVVGMNDEGYVLVLEGKQISPELYICAVNTHDAILEVAKCRVTPNINDN